MREGNIANSRVKDKVQADSKCTEEVGHAFINVRGHVPFAALYYIPRCIPAYN